MGKGVAKRLKGTIQAKLWSMRQADRVFSDYIRNRDGWKCRHCKKDFKEKTGQLHNSHFWGRSRMGTRFDPKNCIALCFFCHYWKFEKEKQGDYRKLMIEWLGQDEYDLLEQRANTITQKRDAIKGFMFWIEPHLKTMTTPVKKTAMIYNEVGQSYFR